MAGCARWLGRIGKTIMVLLLGAGFASPVLGGSVDPGSWVKSDLVTVRDGRLVYDHHSLCAMRDAAATPSERVLVHIEAVAPEDAISRDQFVALVQRMEAVYLMGIGEGWRPGASALSMAQILDCRARLNPSEAAPLEMSIVVNDAGFEATFSDRRAGTTSTHAETWAEAFRP